MEAIVPHTDAAIKKRTDLPDYMRKILENWQCAPGLTSLAQIAISEKDLASSPEVGSMQMPQRYPRFFSSAAKEMYSAKENYIAALQDAYQSEIAAWEFLLIEPSSLERLLSRNMVKRDPELEELARQNIAYLQEQFKNEVAIIRKVPNEDWQKIASCEYPGIALTEYLGAQPEEVKNDFKQFAISGIVYNFFGPASRSRHSFITGQAVPHEWQSLSHTLLENIDAVVNYIFTSKTLKLQGKN